jgi:hypothetical protein
MKLIVGRLRAIAAVGSDLPERLLCPRLRT